MTVFSLSGIEPMTFCTLVKEIDLQDFRRRRSSAVSVSGFGVGWALSWTAAITLQMFSIGDKYGEFGGQSSFGI